MILLTVIYPLHDTIPDSPSSFLHTHTYEEIDHIKPQTKSTDINICRMESLYNYRICNVKHGEIIGRSLISLFCHHFTLGMLNIRYQVITSIAQGDLCQMQCVSAYVCI